MRDHIVYWCAMSGRKVQWSARAAKTLARTDRATRDRIMTKVHQLAENPLSLGNNVKPMNGNQGLWRLRVGDWRVIYSESLVVVSVIHVAPRGSSYD